MRSHYSALSDCHGPGVTRPDTSCNHYGFTLRALLHAVDEDIYIPAVISAQFFYI